MKRLCGHWVAIVILTLVFPVPGTVQGPSGWGRLVASADWPPDGSVHALFDLNASVTGPFCRRGKGLSRVREGAFC